VPLVPREGQNALAREPHPLALKHETLKLFMAHAVRTGTGATLSIHDAMPRNAAVIGKGMKGVADETGMPGKAREKGHLAVGSDTAAWDATDDVVDRRVCGRYRRHRNWGALPNERLQRHASVAQRVRCKPGLYGSAETVTARQSEWKEGVERG